ncbi:aspartyl/lysyl-trna synthetase [Holotrichia oblita]|nr:aspartyl/lysyl-trna synthetase [Holotrichia oblita]
MIFMKKVLVKEIYDGFEATDTIISLSGWVRTVRRSKEVGFIELNDGSCLKNLQIVISAEDENFNSITTGSAIKAEGCIIKSNREQGYELQAERLIIEGLADSGYPISKKRHSFEYLRTIAHLRCRTNTFSTIFRLRSLLTFAVHEYLNKNGFVYIATPCITSSDCEGAGETFKITTLDFNNIPKKQDGSVDYSKDFFGKESYMTVSGQLNLEPFCAAFGKVYTFGPSFRAENSNTTRHSAEFWQVEPEMAFMELPDIMSVIEDMTKYLINYLLEHGRNELEFCDTFIENGLIAKLENTVSVNFASVTYTEALDILQKSGENFEMPVKYGSFHTEWEKYLAEKVYKKPVFVTDYPKEAKSFYMRLNDDGKTVSATDLMFPGLGEIVGASAREERLDVLLERLNECGLDPEAYWWYLDLRKYGTFRHGGFGMGIERMMRYVTGMENIRDVIPFPRTPKNAEF